MILLLTKERHTNKIEGFLHACNLDFQVVAVEDFGRDFKYHAHYSLGVSYCWPYLIKPEDLEIPPLGWINYHPAPLPEYKGPKETTKAIADKTMYWGVSVHYMDENFDTGPLVRCNAFPLWEPPTSEAELGAVAHWYLFKLFKDTIYQFTQESFRDKILRSHNQQLSKASGITA